MAKIIITSDFHIKEGIYVDICLSYIESLMEYAIENDIKDIIIAGDIFDKSSKIKNEAFVPLFFKFMEMKELGFKLVFIIGNHDTYNLDNDSLVETFKPFGLVIKELETIEIDGRKISLLPYTKDESEIPESGDILITHLSIADFTFDNNFHVNEKLGMPISTFKDWNLVFSGHFHRPQNKKNICFMGSPYQLNFGECGQQKGFVVFDTESDKWEREYYDEAPTYLKIKAKDFVEADVSNSFVQVEIEDKLDNYVKLKHLLYDKGAINVVPAFKDTTSNIEIGDDDIIFNSGIKEMMSEYIMSNVSEEKIDNKKLMELFERVLEV